MSDLPEIGQIGGDSWVMAGTVTEGLQICATAAIQGFAPNLPRLAEGVPGLIAHAFIAPSVAAPTGLLLTVTVSPASRDTYDALVAVKN